MTWAVRERGYIERRYGPGGGERAGVGKLLVINVNSAIHFPCYSCLFMSASLVDGCRQLTLIQGDNLLPVLFGY